MFNISNLFPQAIIHIDCDCFFAACEIAKNPILKGKPLVVGKERGIATAITYEAKAMGITRGMRISEIRRINPKILILPGDFETYNLFSRRLFEIVRRFTPDVEEYGIDECFADITQQNEIFKMSYQNLVRKIKQEIEQELNISVSIGLASTKVLAKVASKWDKPSGVTFLPNISIDIFLSNLSVHQIWGIGKQTSKYLNSKYIFTAFEFINQTEEWIISNLNKNCLEIWKELKGQQVSEVNSLIKDSYASIQKTRTFSAPTKDRDFLFSQLSKNLENALIKARKYNLLTKEVSLFLKTQDFKYYTQTIRLTYSTNNPTEIMALLENKFNELYFPTLFRATGITLSKLTKYGEQPDLFGKVHEIEANNKIYQAIDGLSKKYGKYCVHLGSSTTAVNPGKLSRTSKDYKSQNHLKLKIPYLGEVN